MCVNQVVKFMSEEGPKARNGKTLNIVSQVWRIILQETS